MHKHQRRLGRAAAALLLTGALLADSRFHLKTTEYTLSYENLPESFDGFRIVLLSDLHGMRFGDDNRKLSHAVRQLQPDLIAIAGDMVEEEAHMDAFAGLLQGLAGTAPMIYVGGNHEWGRGMMPAVNELLARFEVSNLENRWQTLERGGEKILLSGAADPFSRADRLLPEQLVEALRREEPEAFTLLLGHRNYWVEEYPALPVDLILCGHAHGGVARLPGLGGLLSTHRRLGAEYEKGVYFGEQFAVVVSCGLGNTMVIPRLFNRPEIVSVVLRRGQA